MAYTKYSLTPVNNTAAPPDGAPEGMLPSAVNDTMRDMMAQIRDVGDGVRDGTYTMTAPKITGGTITGVTLTGNTLTNPVITGATLTTSAFNGTVGATTASTGAFTTLSTSSTTTLSGLTASTALALDASKNVVSVTNTGTGNNVLSASPTLTGTIAGASLSLSSLTSGRVTYAGASGLLSDSASLTFDGTSLTTPRLVLGGTTLPSAGTATLFSRTSDNNTYLQTGSGNNFNLLDGSQNTMATFSPTALNFNISNTAKLTLNSTSLYTASGVNVGIGTSSPATKLNIENAGECQLQMAYSSTIFGRVGRLSSGNYEFSSYENGGSLLFGTTTSNGSTTERMRIDSSGNLGIGTTSQNERLRLNSSTAGQARMSISYADSTISFYGSYSGIVGAGSATDTFLSSTNVLAFGSGGTTERMRITSAGLVGIGTSSPSGKLQIDSTNVDPSATANGITLINSTSSQAINNGGSISLGGVYTGSSITQFGYILGAKANSTDGNYAGYLSFGTRPNGDVSQERMRIDSSGNLGLGVTPSAWQTTSGSRAIQFTGSAVYGYRDTNLILTQNAYFDGGFKYYASSIAAGYYGIGSGVHSWYNAPSGTAGNAITFTQAMTLDASGNLLVGTTTKETRGVTIYGSGANALYLKTTGTTNYWITNDGAGTGAGIIATIYNDTTIAGGISVLSNTTAYTSISDYRLKENVQPMTSGLAKVSQLKPVTYTWKVDGASGQGFIAHELAEVVPECVVGEKDAIDEHGNIKPQSVDTSFLVATLTKAIQEQQALIESLTTRLTALENK